LLVAEPDLFVMSDFHISLPSFWLRRVIRTMIVVRGTRWQGCQHPNRAVYLHGVEDRSRTVATLQPDRAAARPRALSTQIRKTAMAARLPTARNSQSPGS